MEDKTDGLIERDIWTTAAARVRGWLRRRFRLQWMLAGAGLALLLAHNLHHLGVRSQVVPAAGDGATRTEA